MLWLVISQINFKKTKDFIIPDINECSMNATLCGQVCLNTAGSYSCACNDGYQFVGGSNQCEGRKGWIDILCERIL